MYSRALYYTQINLICMTILSIYYHNLKKHLPNETVAKREVLHMILWAVITCVADLLCGVFERATFQGARVLLIAANLLYLLSLMFVSFFWSEYVQTRIHFVPKWKKMHYILRWVPLAIVLLSAALTPFTGFLFTVSADGVYQRGVGAPYFVAELLYYMGYATVISLYQCSKETLKFRRRQYYPLFLFLIPPFVAGMIQFTNYGISCYQVGITISISLLCMANQNYEMTTDSLTGVQNRQSLGKVLEELYKQEKGSRLFLFMVDINDFKSVNDQYGHMVGDKLLKQTAMILSQLCYEVTAKIFLCRYGGDEFLLLMRNCEEDIEQINRKLQERFAEETKKPGRMYMTVSIGCAEGTCKDTAEFEKLLKEADDYMYKVKNAHKAEKNAK